MERYKCPTCGNEASVCDRCKKPSIGFHAVVKGQQVGNEWICGDCVDKLLRRI